VVSLTLKERRMKSKSGSDTPPGSANKSGAKQPLAYDSPEWRTLWLRCLEAASAEWNKIPYNDLAISGGDPRKLTRLVDKYYDLVDGEARRQVEAFLRECQPRI
jgi:hypothetical protein